MATRLSFLVIAALSLVIGCAGPAKVKWPDTAAQPSSSLTIDSIPFYPQEAHQCGPAALAMALSWSTADVTPQNLTDEVFTPSRKGSLQSAMIAAARRHDRIPYLLSPPDPGQKDSAQRHLDALVAEVLAGHPVIVLQNLGLSWYPVWHYAVVIGVDPARDHLILHSGQTANKRNPARVFARTWARSGFWAMVVLPPGGLPASLDETGCLRAVSAMEKLARWTVAADGYRAILNRWPDSLPAFMGLGICHYQAGDLDTAEAVFRRAAVRFPENGIVFNNLAEVLVAQGRRHEAIHAATRAVDLGGPLKARFEETLESILSH